VFVAMIPSMREARVTEAISAELLRAEIRRDLQEDRIGPGRSARAA
jgi:hypothetical protein